MSDSEGISLNPATLQAIVDGVAAKLAPASAPGPATETAAAEREAPGGECRAWADVVSVVPPPPSRV